MSNGNNERIQIIIKNTFTISDAYRRIGLLRSCLEESLFVDTDTPFLKKINTCLQSQKNKTDIEAISQWGEELFMSFSSDNISDEMNNVHAEIDRLPVFNLYIPVVFSEQEIASIGKWCRESFSPTVLIDVHIDPSVTGGCSFVWNDTVHEFSLKSRMKKSSHIVTELLSSYE